MPAGGFGTSTTQNLGNISAGRKIVSVYVDVETAFSSYSGNVLPNVEVGDISDPDQFCDSPSNDCTTAGSYVCTPDYVYPSSSTQEMTIRARCNHYSANVANVIVKLTYV